MDSKAHYFSGIKKKTFLQKLDIVQVRYLVKLIHLGFATNDLIS